jgi:hypothetical protein
VFIQQNHNPNLPLRLKQLHSLLVGGKAHATAIKLSDEGRIVEVFEDSEGLSVKWRRRMGSSTFIQHSCLFFSAQKATTASQNAHLPDWPLKI